MAKPPSPRRPTGVSKPSVSKGSRGRIAPCNNGQQTYAQAAANGLVKSNGMRVFDPKQKEIECALCKGEATNIVVFDNEVRLIEPGLHWETIPNKRHLTVAEVKKVKEARKERVLGFTSRQRALWEAALTARPSPGPTLAELMRKLKIRPEERAPIPPPEIVPPQSYQRRISCIIQEISPETEFKGSPKPDLVSELKRILDAKKRGPWGR